MARQTLTIKSLTQGFAQHIKELKAPEYKESQVRLHYIDHFWKLLGWDVDNADQLAPQDVEVQVEPSMDTVEDDGLRSREPDYLFRANGFPRFIVEAKKPAVDIDTDKKAIFQAKRYAWNASIPFAVLMDFEQFRLYDATLKPALNDPDRGLVKEFAINFQDYPDKWEAIAATFGRDAVAAGSLETLLAQVKKIKAGRRVRTIDRTLVDLKGAEPVDRVFLDYLEKFRQKFAQDIYHSNKKDFPEADTLHGAAKLTEAVQRLIDRLVFMRVCEDRGITKDKDDTLRAMLERVGSEGGDFYKTICAKFREMDREYNGYLFKYHFSESLAVSDDILSDVVRTLYPPEGPWDFARIGDDIFGVVYERFLGHTVTVKRGSAVVEKKPEVQHAGGVYYTPRFVVDTIIRRTVGPKIAGKSPAEILDVKILDPACGSGSFLVAAFQFLTDHCLAAVAKDLSLASVPATPRARKKKKDIAFKDAKGRWHLAPDFRAALLTNCIHGVDIDQQAVEVTVMSLYLKMLEGELPPNWQKEWLENELLPSLDSNIVCGNSLIDEASYDSFANMHREDMFGENADTKFRINRFTWESRTRGFGRLLDAQAKKERGRAGFDCIIGNPPYIRVQELNKWAREECDFYKWKYKSAQKGSFDIYMVFTERALDLLSPDGLLGFIMPHKFWQNRDGDGLRKVIVDGKHLQSVIDFGDQQVFKGATTYTAIHILGAKNNAGTLDVARVLQLDDGIAQCTGLDARRTVPGTERFSTAQPIGAGEWRFHDDATQKFLESVKRAGRPLFPDVCDAVFQGIVTGADPIFLTDHVSRPTKSTGTVEMRSEALDRLVAVEAELLVPVVRRQGFQSYIASADHWLLLPYSRTNGEIIPWMKLEKDYPLFSKYVSNFRETLTKREKGKFASRWWGFSGAKNIELWGQAKILVPYMIDKLQAVADSEGRFFVNVTTGGYGLAINPQVASSIGPGAIDYMVGLLNSKLFDWTMRRLSNHFHGGYYPANKQYLQHLPIKIPETADERKLAAHIAGAVRTIVATKTKLHDNKLSDRDRKTLDGEVETYEDRINEIVFQLYGVDTLPNC